MTAETLHRPVSSGQFVIRRQCDRTWKASRPRLSVGFLLTRNFTLTALSSFMDMLRLAADDGDSSRQRHCRWTVMGLGRELVRSSCGLDIAPWDDLRDVQEFDYLVVVGGLLDDGPQLDPTTQAYLREAVRKDVRLIGVCTGVFTLVEAGLMEGRRLAAQLLPPAAAELCAMDADAQRRVHHPDRAGGGLFRLRPSVPAVPHRFRHSAILASVRDRGTVPALPPAGSGRANSFPGAQA
ncbi:DJ-1/PfpI family protein [Azospirillum palustre]